MARKLQEVYQFIQHYLQRYRKSPTLSEIAAGVNIQSTGLLCRYLKQLENANLITRTTGKIRNIQLVKNTNILNTKLPIIGNIAAGQPIESVEQERVLDIAHHLFTNNRCVYQVTTDALKYLHIQQGDYLLAEIRSPQVGEKVILEIPNDEISIAILIEKTNQKLIFNSLVEKKRLIINNKEKDHTIQIKGIFIGLIRCSEKEFAALTGSQS